MDKFEIFNEVNEVHSLNIDIIFVSTGVWILDKSKDFKDLHPSSMLSILLTFNVLKDDIFKDIKEEH